MEPGVQTPEETFERRSGSCRDFELAPGADPPQSGARCALRVGDLVQLEPDVVALDGPPVPITTSPTFTPGPRFIFRAPAWIGLDPTSGLLTGESHIPLAATPHYRNAAPISGLASFANVDFAFDMRVGNRVAEHPRITRPFSEVAWTALDALGDEVDAAMRADDVRLTMGGGEPTFVSIDDFEVSPEEWNTAAVGRRSGRSPTG